VGNEQMKDKKGQKERKVTEIVMIKKGKPKLNLKLKQRDGINVTNEHV
jgi:hypothetical protein